MYDIRIHEFSFYHEAHDEKTPHDERVEATITSIINSFFDEDPEKHDILFYICDFSDERQMARKTLFDRWHNNHGDLFHKSDIVIQMPVRSDSGIQTPDHLDLYASLIRKKDFPYSDIVQTEVTEKAKGMMIGKYG